MQFFNVGLDSRLITVSSNLCLDVQYIVALAHMNYSLINPVNPLICKYLRKKAKTMNVDV